MHTQISGICIISTILKNFLSKKKGCQHLWRKTLLSSSAKYNSFKRLSVFTFFSLSHPHDPQSFYQKTNVPIRWVIEGKAKEQNKCHPFVWASLPAWDHNTGMRESGEGERQREDTQGRVSLISLMPGRSLNTVRQSFPNTALFSLIHQGAS